MPEVLEIFWRAVTNSDFYNVERGPDTGPASGGGQLYFSISFGAHLDHVALGHFLGIEPPDAIRTRRPSRTIAAQAVGDPAGLGLLEFHARYLPPNPHDRYYIARQNRRRASSERHPAWLPDRGFPAAPADLEGPDDPAVPDLSHLKIYVLRADDGSYHAGFANSTPRPAGLPPAVDVLFTPNELCPPNGLIVLDPGEISVAGWTQAVAAARDRTPEGVPSGPEIEDVIDAAARAAGRRASGQGFRESATERRAIERRAMEVAADYLTAKGWTAENVSTTRSYDLHARRGSEVLHVEVKGTTGDGAAVLLTPNEVVLAHNKHPATALLIVSAIELTQDEGGSPRAQGGTIRLIHPWDPDAAGELRPIGFHYVLHA